MSDTTNHPVNRFVDLEARVDDSTSDEEDGEDHGDTDFIDDGPTLKAQLTPRPWRHFRNVDQNPRDPGWVAFLEERYTSEGSGSTHYCNTEDASEKRLLDPEITTAIDNITRLPTDDCPLWRIRCKLGLEKEVVSILLRTAAPRHQIRFAFSHWLAEGWVYVQTNPNRHLYELLRTTPGVIYNRCGPVIQFIPFSEGLELLRMPPSTELPQVGKCQWVQVLKGTYKGDVGYVLSSGSWGLEVLLVPRLSLPDQSGSKRKRSMALFDHETREWNHKIDLEPVHIENFCSFGGNRFQHGLIVRRYSLDSVSTTVSSIPLKSFSFFRFSGHPELIASESTYPRPSEWFFAESDEVFIVDNSIYPPSFKAGVISTLRNNSVELDIKDSGTVSVPWLKICKVIHGGDFVEVTGGIHQGWTGWVVEVNMINLVANIIPTRDEETRLSDCSKTFEVHVNLLKPTAVPHMLGTCPHPSVAIPRSNRVPWINMEVVITGRHSERTRLATVKDVLCNQPTPSGLRVVVQKTYFDASAPFRQLTLDYDNVLEASHAIKLHDYAPPESALFIPRNRIAKILELPTVLSRQLEQPCSSGSATPIPESSFSSSPAWDPSSRTPQPNPDHSLCSSSPSRDRYSLSPQPSPIHSLTSPSSCTSADPLDEGHILLDSRLLNAQLRVVVNGGNLNQKEVTASIQCMDERLSIRRHFYKKSEALLPNWVTPKFPNPTRDNGLLVVIKGEHCGKYVRRIHHRYVDEDAIVILSVVKRVAGHVDMLTGEQLELDVSYLCVCEESKEDKTRNRLLMNELREEARKIRAK